MYDWGYRAIIKKTSILKDKNMATQDELKQQVAKAAVEYVKGGIIGVGTGSTANFFIDELAKVKSRIDGAVASSEATAQRLRNHGKCLIWTA